MKDVETKEVVKDDCKEQIRCLLSNVYDLQKLRISAGNRLVMSFYIQMGVKPSESPDNAEKDERKMIDKLKTDYKRITDGLSSENSTIKRVIKELSSEENGLQIVRNEVDYKLIESYMLLLEAEETQTKVLDKYVKGHPLWDTFFSKIKGCGTLMSACCIAYLDPYKARHVSSFFKYCGLDTVQDTDKEGNPLFLTKEDSQVTRRKVRAKYGYLDSCGNQSFVTGLTSTNDFDAEGNELFKDTDGNLYTKFIVEKIVDGVNTQVYEDIETGEEYVGDVTTSCHGRRMGDTEMFEYIDKDGNTQLKRGITYNPVLKTKLMGVLTGCLLKAKDPTYAPIYYDYRNRLDNDKYKKDYTAGRKNMMAQRYMIKQFVRNLWTTWRDIEGLPVDNPYEVEKLGNKPHKYNEYQVETARKYVV